MNQKLKIFIIFIIVIILSFMLMEQSGTFYEKITGKMITCAWVCGCAKCFEGFIIIFTFLAGLLFFGFLDKNRLNTTLAFVLLMPVFNAITGGLEVGLISLGFGLVGLGLGQIIYITRKKCCKK